jgi:hypothetical protein
MCDNVQLCNHCVHEFLMLHVHGSHLVCLPKLGVTIGNELITQILAKGSREAAGDEARLCLAKYGNFLYFHVLFQIFPYYVSQYLCLVVFRAMLVNTDEPKLTLKL